MTAAQPAQFDVAATSHGRAIRNNAAFFPDAKVNANIRLDASLRRGVQEICDPRCQP